MSPSPLNRFSQKPQPSEASRPDSRPKPGPEDLERLDAFLGDFLLPMLADGQIDAEEETPLVVAYHAYGIDAFDFWFVRSRAEDRIQFGVPGHSRSFAKAWARIQLEAERMTRNDFLRTREWLQEEARHAGLSGLTLPDADPGTIFSVVSIDRTCIARFRKLLDTMRASNLPIAPASVQPQTEPADESEADGSGPMNVAAGTETATGEPAAEGEIGSPSVEQAADHGPDTRSTAPESLPGHPEAEPESRVEATEPEPVAVLDFPIPDSVADSIPGLAARLRQDAPDILEAFSSCLKSADSEDAFPGFLFDEHRTSPANQAIVIDELPENDGPVWFLGDLHGDLLALEAALQHIQKAEDRGQKAEEEPRETGTGEEDGRGSGRLGRHSPRLVVLGDLFDDGEHSYEVVLRLMELVVEWPGRITILAGNHDEALAYDPDSRTFRSSVSPSDFTDWLNSHAEESPTVRGVGEAVVELFRRAPRALFFPDGLFAAHGGIPLSDLWESLQSPADLDRPECLQDFVWTRAHPRARRKIPNRTTRGCEFGYEDLGGFCQAASRALGGHPVRRMVRGHDHIEERYQLYPKYAACPLLTLNAMSRRLAREVFGPYPRVPTVALYRPGHLPQVHRLGLSAEAIRRVYPEPVEDTGETSDSRPQALDSVTPDGR